MVLKWATEDIDNPDLRDRSFIYWRLLSTDPEAARVSEALNLFSSFIKTALRQGAVLTRYKCQYIPQSLSPPNNF